MEGMRDCLQLDSGADNASRRRLMHVAPGPVASVTAGFHSLKVTGLCPEGLGTEGRLGRWPLVQSPQPSEAGSGYPDARGPRTGKRSPGPGCSLTPVPRLCRVGSWEGQTSCPEVGADRSFLTGLGFFWRRRAQGGCGPKAVWWPAEHSLGSPPTISLRSLENKKCL